MIDLRWPSNQREHLMEILEMSGKDKPCLILLPDFELGLCEHIMFGTVVAVL